MILPLLVAIATAGAAASAWGLPRGGREARGGLWAGVLALLAVVVLAFLVAPSAAGPDGTPVASEGDLFGGHLVATQYLRLVIGLESLMAVVVVFVAWLLDGMRLVRGLLPATLAAIAGTTVALGAADLGLAVAAATATGLAALLVLLAVGGTGPLGAATRELRVALVAGAVLLAVVEVLPVLAGLVVTSIGSDAAREDGSTGAVIGLLTLAGGLAVGYRYGVLPFHVRIPRLADAASPIALPLLVAWIPLPLAVAGIAAVDNLVAPLAVPLDGERILVILFAVVTLAGASLAAWIQDDLRHATGYLVIADAGVLLLAVAALQPDAWGPTRAWVVVLAASKTALGAWAAVTEERFGTRSIPDLRGWMRRSPLLASGLVVTIVATFGLPGWVAFNARMGIAEVAADGVGAGLLFLLGWLTLPTYLRLVATGAGRVTSKVDGAAPERFVRGGHGVHRRGRDEQLPVEADVEADVEAAPPAAASPVATAPVPAGARGRIVAAAGAAGASVSSAARSGRTAASSLRAPHADPEPVHERLVRALRRDRAELLAGAVLALALLAALTSWGALDIGGAAAEPAPELVSLAGD